MSVTSLDNDDIAQLMDDAEHFNFEHPDTVLFVTRFAGNHHAAVAARIVDADDEGLQLDLRYSGGATAEGRVDFDQPASSLEEARAGMYALLAKARDIAGDRVPSTSLEIEIAETAKLPTYETSVSAVREITPRMREITFSGGLDRYSPLSPDQFLLVKLPTTGATETSAQAYYTVRRWRPDPGEIDMWFVLHGDQGPLSKWAARAKPGDQVALWGPRSSFDPPPSSTSLLLVADDTGLPAVAAILESSALPGHVIIETLDPGHAVDLDRSAGVSVEWTYRHDSEPGTGTRLLDAVRRLDIDWNDVYAFGAAESRQITSVRRLLRQEQGLPMENVQMTGYWRRPVDGPQTAKEGT